MGHDQSLYSWPCRVQVAWTWMFLHWFGIHPNVLQKCHQNKSSNNSKNKGLLKIDCALLRLCDVLYIVNYINNNNRQPKKQNKKNDDDVTSSGGPNSITSLTSLHIEQCRVTNATVLQVFCQLLASSSCPSLKQVTFHSLTCAAAAAGGGGGGGGGGENDDDDDDDESGGCDSDNSMGDILVNNATLEEFHVKYCFEMAAKSASTAAPSATAGSLLLGQGLARNTNLKRLHLTQCGWHNGDLDNMVASLLSCRRETLTNSSNTASSTTAASAPGPGALMAHINLQWNQISGQDGGRLLGSLIQECYPTSLQELDVTGNPLGPLGARALAPSLVTLPPPPRRWSSSSCCCMSNPTIVLVQLDLTSCHLGNQGIQNLIFDPNDDDDDDYTAGTAISATLSTANHSITTLILSNNGITGDAGGRALGTLLQRVFVQVQHLDISRNPLGTAGLYQLVTNTTTLTQNKQDDSGPTISGRRGRAFEYFNLTGCRLGNHPATITAPSSWSGSREASSSSFRNIVPLAVRCLNVQENGCGSVETATTTTAGTSATTATSGTGTGSGDVLVQALLSCFTGVEELDLRHCRIGPWAAQKLVVGLQQQTAVHDPHRRLRFLGLSFCNLGNDGARLVADTIRARDNVECVAMGGNHISSASATKAVAEMLEQCRNMRKLDISDNMDMFHESSSAKAFARALERPWFSTSTSSSASLRELNITCWDDRNGPMEFPDHVQKYILSGIHKNASLQVVNVDWNQENQRRLDTMLLRNRRIAQVMESMNHAKLASCQPALLETFLEMSRHHDRTVSGSACFLLLRQYHANIVIPSSTSSSSSIISQ